MVLLTVMLIVIALIFGPSLWVKFVMNKYSYYTQKLIKYNKNGKIKNNQH